MKAKSRMLIVILFLFTTVHVLQAQQTPAPSPSSLRSTNAAPPTESAAQPAVYYRLDFVIREMVGEKPVDTRNYIILVQSGVVANMTAGSEVPYPSGSFSTTGTGTGTAKSIQYRSIGVSIACVAKEGNDGVQLDLKLNLSDALPTNKDSDAPAFRKITIDSRTLLALGKPTPVSTVEDPGSRHRYQIDVTATKLK